jgi:hypothetical protein
MALLVKIGAKRKDSNDEGLIRERCRQEELRAGWNWKEDEVEEAGLRQLSHWNRRAQCEEKNRWSPG